MKIISLLTLLFFISTNPGKHFKIEGIQKHCSTNYEDSRERYITLKQNDSIIAKDIKTRFGEFSIKNLNPGNYSLEYKNIYGQTCSKKLVIEKKSIKIEICTDEFLDDGKTTYFDEIKNDTLNFEYHSSGCFHLTKEEIKFYNENEHTIAKIKNEKGEIKTKKLSNNEKKQVSLFFRQLLNIENGMGGCTTVDSYILSMKNKKDLLIVDGSCDWNGFYQIKKIFD